MKRFFVINLIFISLFAISCSDSTENSECEGLEQAFINDTILGFRYSSLEYAPDCFFDRTDYMAIVFRESSFRGISPKIGNEKELLAVDIFHCPIESLPKTLFGLTKLIDLFIEGTNVSEIDEDLGNLVNLVSLGLDSNKISRLPDAFDKMDKLKRLSFRYNMISEWPESISGLESVEEILASGNPISRLPESVKNLSGTLKQLSLRDTDISPEFRDTLRSWLPNTWIYFD